jgi:hypothetical protein
LKSSTRRRRLLDLARAGWGLWLWQRHGTDDMIHGTGTARAAKIAGTRQLAQASLSAARPTGTVMRIGGVVDLIHAVTMAGAAAVVRDHRRVLLADSGIAVAWGVLGLRAAGAVDEAP